MDWNSFFSSVGQSVGGLVGIFAAFIITKIINNQTEFEKKKTKLRERLNLSHHLKDKADDCYFDWYNETKLDERLEYLGSLKNTEDNIKTAEEYYGNIDFPEFFPRDEVLKKIAEVISVESESENSYLNKYTNPMLRDFNADIRGKLTKEKDKIFSTLIEIKQYIRTVELDLSELENNPESSCLVTISIIFSGILFFTGLVYPFSFLPVDSTNPPSLSTLSISAFFTLLFSLKGLILSILSILFLSMLIVFGYINNSLKYDKSDLKQLRDSATLENYSKYYRIMELNNIEYSNWLQQIERESKKTPEITVKISK